jgi:putative addiction module CopG family antidote
MSSMTVSLPAKLKAQIDKRVASGEYDNAEQYLTALLRRDQRRLRQRTMEELLLKRAKKEQAVEMDAADFARIRRRVRQRVSRANVE